MKDALVFQIKKWCEEHPDWHYKSVFEQMKWPKKNGRYFINDTVTRKLREAVERGFLESDTDEHGYAIYRIKGGQAPKQLEWEVVEKDGVRIARPKLV